MAISNVDPEKKDQITPDSTPTPAVDERPYSPKETDQAYEFLAKHHVSSDATSHINLKALRRKIDWHVVTIMFLCYTMQFIDKISLNYAAVMGLRTDLKLQSNDFTNASTVFFVAYLIAELPNSFILNKVPVAKWLGINVILWGITETCTAATFNYHSLLAARIMLAIFEASIAPSLVILSSQWYTKSEQAPRFAFWYSGLGIGEIIGGVISYAFQHEHNRSFDGWKAMFVTLGIVTIIVGIVTLLFLPDSPMSARFLDDTEKAALLQHVSVNQTGVVNHTFNPKHIIELLLDVQVWLLVLILILLAVSSAIITTFSATVINNFGYSPPISALLNMPAGAISIISTMFTGWAIRRSSNRWIYVVVICIPGIIGGGLMSFLPKGNKGGLLAGVYLVNFAVAGGPIAYQWCASNVAGQTKRSIAFPLLTAAYGLGNIIGAQSFQARNAPQYIPAKITVLATQGGGALVAVILYGYYRWANWRRDRSPAPEAHEDVDEIPDAERWRNLTDKENPHFRYVY